MAKNEIYDYEFFDELESQISPAIGNASHLFNRHIYGALYAYYKFNRGKVENILFFETCLQEQPSTLHNEMTVVLFELVHDSTFVDRDRLDLFILNFFKQNFLMNWDKEVRYKQRLIAEYHRVFQKVNYLDEEVWNKLIDMTINCVKIQNMDKYDTMLKGLLWYNGNPKSPKFKKLNKEIEKFKDRIRNSPNRHWKYDVEKVRWRTYDELLLTREEFDENYIHIFPELDMNKQDLQVVSEKKEITFEEVKKMVSDKLKKNINIMKLKNELIDESKLDDKMIEEAIMQITKENQKKMVDDLKRKGMFIPDMPQEKIAEMKKAYMKAVPAAKAGKKDAAGGKKK
jgi:hypothetical protein